MFSDRLNGFNPFLACLYKCTGRAIALLPAWALALAAALAVASALAKVFMLKFFYMMGKALTGELSYTQTGLV